MPWLISAANSNRPRVALIRPKSGWCRVNVSIETAKEDLSMQNKNMVIVLGGYSEKLKVAIS